MISAASRAWRNQSIALNWAPACAGATDAAVQRLQAVWNAISSLPNLIRQSMVNINQYSSNTTTVSISFIFKKIVGSALSLPMDCRIKFGNDASHGFRQPSMRRTCVGRCPVWSKASALPYTASAALNPVISRFSKAIRLCKIKASLWTGHLPSQVRRTR